MSKELRAKVTADVSDFNKKMHSIGVSAKSAAKTIATVITAATAATAALGIHAIKTAVEYEMLEKRIKGVFGAKGGDIFKDLIKSAQSSSLETKGLTESFIRFSALRGYEPQIKTIEAIGFAAKVLNKDIGFITEQFARLFNQMERGENVDKKVRDALVGAFGTDGKSFMKAVVDGTMNADEALQILNRRGVELGKVFNTGFDSELSQLEGSWDNLMLKLSDNENIVAISELFVELRAILDELASSDAIKNIATSMTEMVSSISSEDISEVLNTMVKAVNIIATVSTHIIKNWKKYGALLIIAKLSIYAIQVGSTALLYLSLKQTKEYVKQAGIQTKILNNLAFEERRLTSKLTLEKRITLEKEKQRAVELSTIAPSSARRQMGQLGGGYVGPINPAFSARGGKGSFLPPGTSKLGAGLDILTVAVVGYTIGKVAGDLIAAKMDDVDSKNFGRPQGEEYEKMRQRVINDRRGAMSEEAHKRWVANLPPGPKLT